MLPMKYHTAPSRMRKRDTNVWDDLHALLDAADQPQHGLQHPHHAATLSGAPDALAARFAEGGSWSRQFKRRTSEEGNSMSLWEVGEALSVAASQPPTAADTAEAPAADNFAISDLNALQALVDAEAGEVMAQGADVDDTQRFVDSVFGDAAADTLPELTLMRTETTETNEDDLQDDLLLSMLRTDGAAWDLERQFSIEGPESPSPTSVTTLFGEALSGDGSPRDDALAARQPQGVFHAALTQRLEGCAERPAAPGAATLPALSFPSTTPLSTTSRNGAERKEWTAAEDEIIHSSVLIHGCKWRRIAALLPGRSDDAVRNRWNRLKAEQGLSGPPASEAPPPAARRAACTSSDGASKPERVSWTKAEDATILSSVQELGHKWNKLAERLPGRTDHAIRNRFHRLQTMLEDKQREQQRMLAPAEPLPPHLTLA